MFVDEVRVHVKGGRGGNGVTSFARQPFEPRGRPDGGDGGHGGSVVLRASGDVATLVDYHHRPHRSAGSGRHGEETCAGARTATTRSCPCRPGRSSATPTARSWPTSCRSATRSSRRPVDAAAGATPRSVPPTGARPRFHELGEPPHERWLVLELKLVADVALVGFPNAGKSSLIARLSAAKPKIAGYPFTTLAPNLGVVRDDDVDFVVADVPGLLEGASDGRGLGHTFLRHVERAAVLVHVLDCASYEQRDPREDLRVVVDELAAYQAGLDRRPGWVDLLERPALVFLNKTDADPDTAEIVAPALEADGWEVLSGSAVTGAGLGALRHRMAALVTLARDQRTTTDAELDLARPVLRPGKGGDDLRVERSGDGWRVSSERVHRWVVMTDLGNEEAVRYLQGRMVRAGVERALIEAGARRGDPVDIAGAVFDFEPDAAGEELDAHLGGLRDDLDAAAGDFDDGPDPGVGSAERPGPGRATRGDRCEEQQDPAP